MNKKRWVYSYLSYLSILLAIVFFINFFIDPLWFSSDENKFNKVQKGYDERLAKTNFIYNNKLNDFNGLLFGSSRTTHINQSDFKFNNMKIYNYATSSMDIWEYDRYIEFAKKVKGSDFKYIIIGLDFYNTNKFKDKSVSNPEYYINKVQETNYYIKSNLSYDSLEKSVRNIKYSLKGKDKYYDRDNNHNIKVSENDFPIEDLNRQLKFYGKKVNEESYEWDDNYSKYLRILKEHNPNTTFILFTSPVMSELTYLIVEKNKRLNEYKKWLENTINIFGNVYHFMYFNEITNNINNYLDIGHYYQKIGKLIAHDVSVDSDKIFGLNLNKDNLNEFFLDFENDLKNFESKN